MLIHVLIVLIVAGALLYIVELIPIDATMKRIAQVVIIVVMVIYLLQDLGALVR